MYDINYKICTQNLMVMIYEKNNFVCLCVSSGEGGGCECRCRDLRVCELSFNTDTSSTLHNGTHS